MRNFFNHQSCMLGLAVAAVVGLAGSARAAITITLDPASPTGTGPFTYTYSLQDSLGDELVSGSFFRIYDFLGYVSSTVSAPAGWTTAVDLTDPVPPPNVILNDGDSATVPNLVFTYTGSTITGPSTIDGFTAESIDPLLGGIKNYVGRDTQATGPTAGQFVDSVGSVQVPGPATPEPASLAVLGLGSLALMVRRRNSRK